MEETKAVEQMTVLMGEPGYAPYEKTIPNTLQAKQEHCFDLNKISYNKIYKEVLKNEKC